MLKPFLFSLFFIPFFLFSQTDTFSRIQINLEEVSLSQISSLGIPIEGEFSKGKWVTELRDSDLQLLKNNNVAFTLLINDMASYYQNRNSKIEKNNSIKTIGCQNTSINPLKPAHFKHGSFAGYLSLNEIYQELDSMHLLFPELTSTRTAIDTFHTTNGLPMYFIKISKNANIDENENRVLYTSLTHAREPMGMQQLIWFMWYMLENYNVNDEITYLLDHTELYFIPCSNPDGYLYNETTNPNGGGLWRKNRRDNGDGTFGVDLNRNWGYQWGYDNQGSSPTTSSDVYRGPSGFSENETKAIKWLAENRTFKLAIDHHCYSNILLYPWGYQNAHTPDHELFVRYSKKMTKKNHFSYGIPAELLYTANGGTFDWYYGEQISKPKIIALSPEAGTAEDGFWPQESRIDDIALDFFEMNLYLARFAFKYGEVEDKSLDVISSLQGTLPFEFLPLGLDSVATFKISYLPISSNISDFGNPIVVSNPDLNVLQSNEMTYSLNSSIAEGDEIVFVISLQIDQLITYNDTIRKIFGHTQAIFQDSCNNVSQWTSSGGNWVATNTDYVSPSFSICDSYGNYSGNTNKSITLNNAVNLHQVTNAKLNFYAKWDLEKSYDFVKIEASIDNGINWDALCGKYTVTGSEYQEMGLPCYDGTQSEWVLEEIDLNAFIGEQVKFRFVLKSDALTHGDGFYFDDFKITALMQDPTQILTKYPIEKIQLYPNPNNGRIFCDISDFNSTDKFEIVLFDALGKTRYQSDILNRNSNFDLNLETGIYIGTILKNNCQIYWTKLIYIP